MSLDPVSTEGRIFAAQLTRELAKRERAGAALITPGSVSWYDAMHGFAKNVAKISSPVKAARSFRETLAKMRTAQKAGSCFVNCFERRSRSAYFELLTWEVARHPLTGTGNDGVLVKVYGCRLQRGGCIRVGSSRLAFIGWHALARMRERSKVDVFSAEGIVAGIGFAGLLMRESDPHLNTSISYAAEDMTAVGVLRHALNDNGTSYGFFDVLTTLPADAEKHYQQRQRDQGIKISWAVHTYLTSNDADPAGYGASIPVVPFDDSDYVSRVLKERATNASGNSNDTPATPQQLAGGG